MERAVAQGKVDLEKVPTLLNFERDWSPTLPSHTEAGEAISIYEKFPSVGFRATGIRGQRRAYNAPWASTHIRLCDSPTHFRPSKQVAAAGMRYPATVQRLKHREKALVTRLTSSTTKL